MGFWKQTVLILLVAFIASAVSAFVHPKRPAWFLVEDPATVRWQITLERAEELVGEGTVVWIDAREPSKFEAEHLPGALSLSPVEWADAMVRNQEALQLAFGNPVVVYCDGKRCDKSYDIAQRLRELLGLDPVYVLKGDWRKLVPLVSG